MTVPPDEESNVRALILAATGDTPAREDFMCINTHTGECSCTKCEQRGERVENVFPYQPEIILRTDENIRIDALFAAQLNDPDGHVNGVKALTEFANLMPNFVRAFAIDEMHNVQGVIKKLLKLWFDPSHHMFNYNRSGFVDVVDDRLKKVKGPMFIKRKARSIKNHLAYFKMSELKSIGLLYSVAVFQGTLSEDHLRYYMLFLIAVWLLSSKSVSEEDINLSDRLLTEFVKRFSDLYDVKFLTINVHQLLHLPSMVRDHGPLPVTSCFGREDIMGQILSIVHGTRFTEKQISSKVPLYLAVPQLVSDLDPGPAKEFCARMLERGRKFYVTEEIDERSSIVGKCVQMFPVPDHVQNILDEYNVAANNVFKFNKLCRGKLCYTTGEYDEGKSTNSSCITFSRDGVENIGVVRTFIKVLNCACIARCEHDKQCYAIVDICEVTDTYVSAEPYTFKFPILLSTASLVIRL